MNTNTKKLAQFLLLLGVASSVNNAIAENAGRVLVAVGEVSALRNGKTIPLSLGSAIESGDALRTGPTSNAQVRLSDGGIIALRPQTEFRLDEYRFSGEQDGSEKGFFSLIKGGFRAITGLIGKTNQKNYKVDTATATIGIRGTDYGMVICEQNCSNADGSKAKDGLYGNVVDGKINVSNEGGVKDISRNEAFFVADRHSVPQLLIAPPSFLADRLAGQSRNQNRGSGKEAGKESPAVGQAPLATDGTAAASLALALNAPYQATETVNSTGGSAVLPAGKTLALVVAYAPVGGSYSLGNVENASNLGLSGGNLLSYNQNSGEWTGTAGSSFTNQGSTVIDGSNIYWGRWLDGSVNNTSGYHGTLSGAALPTGVHYMFGDANTSDAVMAAKSGSVNYTFASGTLATDSAGAVGTKMSGSLGVDFTARTVTPNISYSVGGYNYNITGFSMPIGGSGFSTSSSSGNNTGSCSGGACSTGIPINFVVMNGNFVGAAAQGAITSVATHTSINNQSTAVVGLFKAP